MEWFGQDGHVSYDTYINFSYPLHFHRSLEFVYLEEGGLTVLEPKRSTNTWLQKSEKISVSHDCFSSGTGQLFSHPH